MPATTLRFASSMRSPSAMSQLPGERVAQQAEGLAGRLRRRTAAEDAHAAGRASAAALELAQQSALAEAGLGDHGDHRQAPFGVTCASASCSAGKLGVAADHARVHALDAARGACERCGAGRAARGR